MHSAEEYEENNNNIRFSILHKPYEQTPGGDFYEVFEPIDQYRFIIYGDVMGKKWGAWLFVQAFTSYVHSTYLLILPAISGTPFGSIKHH